MCILILSTQHHIDFIGVHALNWGHYISYMQKVFSIYANRIDLREMCYNIVFWKSFDNLNNENLIHGIQWSQFEQKLQGAFQHGLESMNLDVTAGDVVFDT